MFVLGSIITSEFANLGASPSVKVVTELQLTMETMLQAAANPITHKRHIPYQMLIARNVSMIVFLYTNMEGLKLSKYTDAVLCQYDTRLCCKFFYSFSLSVGLSVSLCSFSLFPCGTVLLSLSLIRVARYNNTHTLSLLHQGMSLFHSLFHQPVRQS